MTNELKRKSRKNFKYFETNYNANKTYEKLWNEAKELLRGIVIALNKYILKEEMLTN